MQIIPQGLWLGWFAAAGSFARVVGPLLVTEIYQEFGTYAMLIVVGVTMVRLGLDLIEGFTVKYIRVLLLSW